MERKVQSEKWEQQSESESDSVVPESWAPLDCTVHGILQASTLEWVALPVSRGSSQSRDQTQVSGTAGRFFTSWATRIQAQMFHTVQLHFYEILDVAKLQWWAQNTVARG